MARSKKNLENSAKNSAQNPTQNPTAIPNHVTARGLVVGSGWTAQLSVAAAVLRGEYVFWSYGQGSQIEPILPLFGNNLEYGLTDESEHWLRAVFNGFGIELGERAEGNWLREFKNKSFKPIRIREKDDKAEIFYELELPLIENSAIRLDFDWIGSFQKLTEKLREHNLVGIRNPSPLVKLQASSEGSKVLTGFADGTEFEVDWVIETESPALLRERAAFKGLENPWGRTKDASKVLQVDFWHAPMAETVREAFVQPLPRDSQNEKPKRAFGYFSPEGSRSRWSIFLSDEEAEDNNEIGKKLRKLKNTLNKMFCVEPWVQNPEQEWTSKITREQVRFAEDAWVLPAGHLRKAWTRFSPLAGVSIASDALGIAASIRSAVEMDAQSSIRIEEGLKLGAGIEAEAEADADAKANNGEVEMPAGFSTQESSEVMPLDS